MSEVDAKRLLDYYKELGPKFNDSLIMRTAFTQAVSGSHDWRQFPNHAGELDHRNGLNCRWKK